MSTPHARRSESLMRSVKRWGARVLFHLGELRVYSAMLPVGRTRPRRNFVVFCQGRTGSTLLVQLLSVHPEIRCAGEVLWADVFWPRLYVRALSLASDRPVYGCKIKIEHLTVVQRVSVRAFLQWLSEEGWLIIHLQRANILRQSLSFLAARQTGIWHTGWDRGRKVLRVEPEALVEVMRARQAFVGHEVEALEGIPHLPVAYEEDLLDAGTHQATADRIFAALGLRPVAVSATVLRTGGDQLSAYLENVEEVKAAVTHAGFAGYLDGV